MKRQHFTYESVLPFPQEEVFSWHLREGALQRLLPPFMRLHLLQRGDAKEVGSTTHLKMYLGPLSFNWIAKHVHFDPKGSFIDEAIKSPFPYWRHIHSVKEHANGCILSDTVEYIPLPFIPDKLIQKRLNALFSFRHERIKRDLTVCHRYPLQIKKVLVSGSRGFVGSQLICFLSALGHEVHTLQRGKSDPKRRVVGWDSCRDTNIINEFEGFDAVIHLAGENIAGKAWTAAQKEKIFQSRSRDTWLLSQILLRLKNPPKVFISASAVGIYGDRNEEVLTEDSSVADDFLASVCTHWERASESLLQKGVRRCIVRFGYILSPQGGMLAKILPSFKMGLGAQLGSGKQWMPWVALDDVIYALYHLLMREDLDGVFNITAPEPSTQREFARSLAKALRRPMFLALPKTFLRMILGERADALLLRSTRALPKKLQNSGFSFCFTRLQDYFSECL